MTALIDSGLVGEVSQGEKTALRGTDPDSYITKYIFVYEDIIMCIYQSHLQIRPPLQGYLAHKKLPPPGTLQKAYA